MRLSFVAPWEKQLVVIKIIKNWFIVAYPTILVTNVIYMKVMMKSGCIYQLFLMVFQNR
jgi:ABC-type transport system involved in cytochrome c biogenesis permease component